MNRAWMVAAIPAGLLLLALLASRAFQPGHGDGSSGEPVASTTIKLDGVGDAVLQRHENGTYDWLLPGHDGRWLRLSPDAFSERVYREHAERDWLSALFNISSPVGIIWVSLGLLGQLLFTGRMLVQWLVSERHRRSIVPPLFWWLSLVGASMLLAYFLWRRDVVGVLGQAFGWVVYVRNLHLIYFGTGRVSTADDPAPEAELDSPSMTGSRQPSVAPSLARGSAGGPARRESNRATVLHSSSSPGSAGGSRLP